MATIHPHGPTGQTTAVASSRGMAAAIFDRLEATSLNLGHHIGGVLFSDGVRAPSRRLATLAHHLHRAQLSGPDAKRAHRRALSLAIRCDEPAVRRAQQVASWRIRTNEVATRKHRFSPDKAQQHVNGATPAVLALGLYAVLFSSGHVWALAIPLAIPLMVVTTALIMIRTAMWGWIRGHNDATLHLAEDVAEDREAERKTAELQAAEVAARRREMEAECDRALDLPYGTLGERYVYVLGFSTGSVKVGQSFDPARRIREHRRDAAAFGVVLVSFWVSPAHHNYLDNEVALIDGCAAVSDRVRREYFTGIKFTAAVKIACGLEYFSKNLDGKATYGGWMK